MAYNFPISPTVGQLYPTPAVPGSAQYVWNGSVWDNVAAAPVDALALNGMQVNGDMRISQELGTSGRSNGGYVIDAWRVDSTAQIGQTTQPISGGSAPGFVNHLLTSSTAAVSSINAGEYVVIHQTIEGFRIARLGWGSSIAQPITIAFWTAHARTGTYTGAIRSSTGPSYSYIFSYTQNVANTWEYKTVTISGATVGTWATDNTNGMNVLFTMACGPTYIAPAVGVWYNVNYMAGPGQVNGVAATSDRFRLTGVVVLPGTLAPSAANSPNIIRPFDQEFLLCSRYFQFNRPREYGFFVNPYRLVMTHVPIVPYRASPTITLLSSSIYYENWPWVNGYTLTGVSAVNASHMTATGGDYVMDGTGGGSGRTDGSAASIGQSTPVLKFDART